MTLCYIQRPRERQTQVWFSHSTHSSILLEGEVFEVEVEPIK
jgi:hypothetical protein